MGRMEEWGAGIGWLDDGLGESPVWREGVCPVQLFCLPEVLYSIVQYSTLTVQHSARLPFCSGSSSDSLCLWQS